jgi:hypothetical protein
MVWVHWPPGVANIAGGLAMITDCSKRRVRHPDSVPRVHPRPRRWVGMLGMMHCGHVSGAHASRRQISLTWSPGSSCARVQVRFDITRTMPLTENALTENERALFALARERITQGILPGAVPPSVWAGAGSQSKCSLCGETIEPVQVEYELKGSAGAMFHFHLRCHAIWQLAASDSTKGLNP